MKTLLKSATIVDPGSAHHLKIRDLLIEDGIISKIAAKIDQKAERVVDLPNLHVSVGWFDPGVSFGEPGMEERESLSNGLKTAAWSGFTTIGVSSNTRPVPDSRSGIEFVLAKGEQYGVRAIPMGALTMMGEGKDLAELFDMHTEGALAFYDHKQPVQNANLLKIALQYCVHFGGLVHSFPLDNSLAYNGVMNEGVNSTMLGMKGIPEMSEAVQIERDLRILSYSGGSLHIPTVSTLEGVAMIAQAKAQGLDVSCSISVNNLVLDDSALSGYDSRFKLMPPLRASSELDGMRKALEEGLIDGVTTDHTPLNIELKDTEFDLASFGSIGLESGFGALCGATSIETAVAGFTNLREVYGLEELKVEEGQAAELTLFDPNVEWTFSRDQILSSNSNAALLDMDLTGRAYGILTGDHLELRP